MALTESIAQFVSIFVEAILYGKHNTQDVRIFRLTSSHAGVYTVLIFITVILIV